MGLKGKVILVCGIIMLQCWLLRRDQNLFSGQQMSRQNQTYGAHFAYLQKPSFQTFAGLMTPDNWDLESIALVNLMLKKVNSWIFTKNTLFDNIKYYQHRNNIQVFFFIFCADFMYFQRVNIWPNGKVNMNRALGIFN